jgi:hypothetical protein
MGTLLDLQVLVFYDLHGRVSVYPANLNPMPSKREAWMKYVHCMQERMAHLAPTVLPLHYIKRIKLFRIMFRQGIKMVLHRINRMTA